MPLLKILLPSIQGLSLGTLSILDKFTAISTSQEDLTAVLTALDQSTYGFYKDDRIISLIRDINRNISQKLQVCDLDHKQILKIEIFCQVRNISLSCESEQSKISAEDSVVE